MIQSSSGSRGSFQLAQVEAMLGRSSFPPTDIVRVYIGNSCRTTKNQGRNQITFNIFQHLSTSFNIFQLLKFLEPPTSILVSVQDRPPSSSWPHSSTFQAVQHMGATGHQAVVPSQPQAPRLCGQADGHLAGGRMLRVDMDGI